MFFLATICPNIRECSRSEDAIGSEPVRHIFNMYRQNVPQNPDEIAARPSAAVAPIHHEQQRKSFSLDSFSNSDRLV